MERRTVRSLVAFPALEIGTIIARFQSGAISTSARTSFKTPNRFSRFVNTSGDPFMFQADFLVNSMAAISLALIMGDVIPQSSTA